MKPPLWSKYSFYTKGYMLTVPIRAHLWQAPLRTFIIQVARFLSRVQSGLCSEGHLFGTPTTLACHLGDYVISLFNRYSCIGFTVPFYQYIMLGVFRSIIMEGSRIHEWELGATFKSPVNNFRNKFREICTCMTQ